MKSSPPYLSKIKRPVLAGRRGGQIAGAAIKRAASAPAAMGERGRSSDAEAGTDLTPLISLNDIGLGVRTLGHARARFGKTMDFKRVLAQGFSNTQRLLADEPIRSGRLYADAAASPAGPREGDKRWRQGIARTPSWIGIELSPSPNLISPSVRN